MLLKPAAVSPGLSWTKLLLSCPGLSLPGPTLVSANFSPGEAGPDGHVIMDGALCLLDVLPTHRSHTIISDKRMIAPRWGSRPTRTGEG